MTRSSSLCWLTVFLLGGALIRLVGLAHYPPSLNWDEVSLGYNAYSLLHSGKDEWGVAFPAIFRAFGDYKLPLYVYADVPAVAVFGLSPAGVRLPSALAGIGLIAVSFLLAYRIFTDRRIAVLTAFLVAVSQWTLFLSRVAVEANLAAFFISLGIYLGLTKRFYLSAVFLGLSVWTYNSARVFVPLLVFVFILFSLRRLKSLLLPLLVAGIFIVPMLIQLLLPTGQARFDWVTLIDSGAVAQIAASRASSHFPYPRLLYNKVTYFSGHFLVNYLQALGPDFLFIDGGSQYQFNIPHLGLLGLVNLPFFYLGLIFLVFSRSRTSGFILLWLLLAPVAGSLTRDAPHTLRLIPLLPLPMLISAFGLVRLPRYLPLLKYPLYAVFIAGVIYAFADFSYVYTSSYPVRYSWSWQYGYSQVVSYIKQHYSQYDGIIFTKKYGEPHEFVLFYWPWPPAAYRTDPRLVRYYRTDWYWVDAFAKFRFVNDWDMTKTVSGLSAPGKYLIISSPDNPVSVGELGQIDFLNGHPAFIISQKAI